MYRLADRVSVWGDLGWGFRAPTLNELYRQFRVGTVVTLPNNGLGPERLVGGEIGLNVEPTRRLDLADDLVRRPHSRRRGEHHDLDDAGARHAPAPERRPDARLGDPERRGVPDWRVPLALSAGYLFEHARVTEFAPDPSLVGKYLPQVPTNRASARVIYTNPRLATLGLELQAVGRQFDDDQNVVVVPGRSQPGLPAYAVVNLTASREIRRGFGIFAGVQNLFDHQYIVGTRPTTIGSPLLVDAGVRVRFGR